MKRWTAPLIAIAAAVALLLPVSLRANAHFLRYILHEGALIAVPEKFDIASLPGHAVPYVIRNTGPIAFADGDSFPALLSQIQSAAEVWNGIGTSTLKLKFAGLSLPGMPMNTPHVEVLFDELPPGIVAMGGPETRGDLVERENERFFQIIRSRLVLPRDMQTAQRQSSSERFFLTLVHEFGHTVGLQHSWASGVMSTEITRATMKGAPLTADDRAGISALYPAPGWQESTGAITGHVTLDSAGVHLASVVALSSTGHAVSTLTAIDGSYRIKGLPHGEYFVYAQPVPPSLEGEPQPVNLELPLGPDGPIAPGPVFNTIFYPGTEAAESKVGVGPGQIVESIDFAVSKLDRVNVHSVQTYSFIGAEAQKPSVMWPWQPEGQIVLYGFGLSTGSGPVQGLTANVVGGLEPVTAIMPYEPSPVYLDLRVGLTPEAPLGVRHMRFTVNGERHVTPSAYRVTATPPPVITAATRNEDGTLTLEGERLTPETVVRLDGYLALPVSADAEAGTVTVRAPYTLPGHSAVVSAYDREGQSSLMVSGNNSLRVDSTATEAPRFHFSDNWIEPGTETIVEITSDNADFQKDGLKLGFGTSDVIVKQIWVTGHGQALAWVITANSAPEAWHTATASTGLAYSLQEGALHLTSGESRRPFVVMSSIHKPAETYSGVDVVLPLANVGDQVDPAAVSVSIGDLPAQVVSAEGAHVTVKVPEGLRAGLHRLIVSVAGLQLLPAVIELVDVPPVILKAQTVMGVDLNAHYAPAPGEVFQLIVSGLSNDRIEAESLSVRSHNLAHTVLLTMESGIPGTKIVVFHLSEETPREDAVVLTISWNGRTSAPFEVPLRK